MNFSHNNAQQTIESNRKKMLKDADDQVLKVTFNKQGRKIFN